MYSWMREAASSSDALYYENEFIDDAINPSYHLQEQIRTALRLYSQPVIDMNELYVCTRRYDKVIDKLAPVFMPKKDGAVNKLDENKPCKLKLRPHEEYETDPDFALMKYMWTHTESADIDKLDLNFLKSLIDSGVDINTKDEHGQTMLHACVRDWHSDVILFAMNNNACVNAQDDFGRSPLHLAAALNAVDATKVLLRHGADPNIETYDDYHTPLHYAAKYNALEALKVLIMYGGCVTSRDYKGRTVCHVGADACSRETTQFLLDIQISYGVFDNEGNSALTSMVEQMPRIAYHALNEYVTSEAYNQCEMYLSYLESDTNEVQPSDGHLAISPLEAITTHDDMDLIMHPVVQRAIEMKWNLFGRKDTLWKLFITMVYLICWLVLAYYFSDRGEFYYDSNGEWSHHAWTIVLEFFIIVFALYFYFKDFIMKQRQNAHHQRRVRWRRNLIRREYTFCHPMWPNERLFLDRQIERIKSSPSLAGKHQIWFRYEWVILVLLLAVIVTRIIAMAQSDSKTILLVHKCVFVVSMMFSFFRLLKIIIRFRYFAVFLKVTGSCVAAVIQIGFLYIQVLIPFVAAFWILMDDITEGLNQSSRESQIASRGSNESRHNASSFAPTINITNNQSLDLSSSPTFPFGLDTLFFYVYGLSFGQEGLYDVQPEGSIPFQVAMSLFHILSTFIALSIVIGFVTATFRNTLSRCTAEASLLQAYVVLQLEQNMSKEEKSQMLAYYNTKCNPLVITGKISVILAV